MQGRGTPMKMIRVLVSERANKRGKQMQITKTNTNLMIEKQESPRMECEAVCE